MDNESDAKTPLLSHKRPKWWRALPGLALIIVISTIDGLILNDFIEYRFTNLYQDTTNTSQTTQALCLNATHKNVEPTGLVTTTKGPSPISTTMSAHDRVQTASARLNVYTSLAATLPSILTSILLGTNCDRIGRKPLILLPFIGKIIRYIIFTAVAYWDLADLWIILAVTTDGIFGTSGLSMLSCFAYATDCSDEKSRTKAIIVTDVCISCSRFIPLMAMGIYLQHPNYIPAMLIGLGLSILGFFFCVIFQPESNLEVQNSNFFKQFRKIKLTAAKNMFQVFLRKREGHKQRSLLLLVGSHLSIITMVCGGFAMYYLYLYGTPFCMDSFGVSLNTTAQSVLIILLTIPYTLSSMKNSDHLLWPILGSLAYIVELILFSIAKTIWMLYVAVCIGSLFTLLTPVIRSRITKLVEPQEYAVVFILAGILESGGYYAISAMTNEIYEASFLFFPGLVFIVLTFFGFLCILLLIILYSLEKNSSQHEKLSSINN